MTVTAGSFNTIFEACLDGIACLVPDVRKYESDPPNAATYTWTKPAHALWVRILLVDAGQEGGHGSGSAAAGGGGGGGGCNGAITERVLPADDVPATLLVYVPYDEADGHAAVSHADEGFQINSTATYNAPISPAGATGGGGGSRSGDFGAEGLFVANGGAGGDANPATAGDNGLPGGAGYCTTTQAGGDGGLVGGPIGGQGGQGGIGYGAGGGGGGGRGVGGSPTYHGGGGGGGGGGYGTGVSADGGGTGTSDSGAPGGAGAPGLVLITTWCGVNLRA